MGDCRVPRITSTSSARKRGEKTHALGRRSGTSPAVGRSVATPSGNTAAVDRIEGVAFEPLARPPGDSTEQREAEKFMVEALSAIVGKPLSPRRVFLPDGGRLELDAVADDASVLAEAWAHQGPPKSAQRYKVLVDAFKLKVASDLLGGSPRLILAFSDESAAAPFQQGRRGWAAFALRREGIEVVVVQLPPDVREAVAAAQRRQYR
jgi:hypothetical protein